MTEVATRETGPSALIANHRNDFAMVLPALFRPETYVRLAQGALRRDPKLMEAAQNKPVSLMVALLECARLGHEPGTEDFYLTPRKVGGELEVLGIEGYRGVIKRMFNSGQVASIVAEVVYSGDQFNYVPGIHERPIHHVDWFGERGNLLGAYAYAVMTSGATSKVVVIGPKDITRSRSASKGADSQYSPWTNDPDAMYRKTALHRLEPYVAKASSAQWESNAAAEDVRLSQNLPDARAIEHQPAPDATTGEVLTGELMEMDHARAAAAAREAAGAPPWQ